MSVAVKFTGYNRDTTVTDTFRFSDSGFTRVIGDDSGINYYKPLISDSIIIKQDASKTDALSVRLHNNGELDFFDSYIFDGYELEVFLNLPNSPNPYKFYTIYSGKIDRFSIKRESIDIRVKSNFYALEEPINTGTFTGVYTNYEGTEAQEGKTKPRIIGKVFNINPVLIKYNTLVYGCNWDYSGNRDSVSSFDSVKDGGVALTLDVSAGSAGDFSTTALMDAYSPPSGYYVTCVAEGTFKLGSSPVFDVTCDVDQGSNTYQSWLQILATETSIAGLVNHNVANYTIGAYFDSQVTYLEADKTLAESMDIALWIDSSVNINARVLNYTDSAVVNMIESGLELTSSNDIPYLELKRIDYELPATSAKLNFKKNYFVQNQSGLAGVLTEDEKEILKAEYRTTPETALPTASLYPKVDTVELTTSIQDSTNADTELARWMDFRDDITDLITIKCKILSSNETIILGAIAEGAVDSLTISNTDEEISASDVLISDNNTSYTEQTALTLGSVITVTDSRFSYSSKTFVITGLLLNTREMTVTYNCRGLR